MHTLRVSCALRNAQHLQTDIIYMHEEDEREMRGEMHRKRHLTLSSKIISELRMLSYQDILGTVIYLTTNHRDLARARSRVSRDLCDLGPSFSRHLGPGPGPGPGPSASRRPSRPEK